MTGPKQAIRRPATTGMSGMHVRLVPAGRHRHAADLRSAPADCDGHVAFS
jgi:hypothetical protein